MIEKKILFVDDEESQRDIMRRVLQKIGYCVTLSSNSAEALEILSQEYFPLIITDLSMPGMDGAALCKQIREENQSSIIYALSGFIETYQAEKLEEAGFDGYLRKPATTAMIKKAVDGAFDKLQHPAS